MINIEKEKNNIIAGIFLLIFCGYFLYEASKYSFDAALFPRITLVAIAIFTIMLILKSLIALIKSSKKINWNIIKKIKNEKMPLTFYLMLLIYIYLLPKIGFEISVVLFITAGMFLINRKELKKYFYIPFVLPVLFYIVFRILLNVNLPSIGFWIL